jgi:two-component system phosphate regulon sensor histidine kinase PhoR
MEVMDKRIIWIIIGLMGMALVGICWLQFSWIRSSIQLNESQFDIGIHGALNKVAERLEYEEQLEFYQMMNNGYLRSFIEEEMTELVEPLAPGHEFIPRGELFSALFSEHVCDCSSCRAERVRSFSSVMQFYQGLERTQIAERINLRKLDALLRDALADQGIRDIEYDYGVYSRNLRSFVIINKHYVVPDEILGITAGGNKNLYTSKYSVSLFKGQDGRSPGLLMIFFPNRTSYLWESVWQSLLASVLFTGVIFFCFAYSVHIIFRQKKLSEMKTDFINNMTHEFKTPIATISLAADSITSPLIIRNPEKLTRFANIIRQENKRMNSQVEKVLQMALLDKRDFQLNLTGVNLHEVIERALQNISLQVEKRGGAASSSLQATQPVVQGDQTHLANIINNLLDNANKYSSNSPEISVTTRNVPNGVEVIVSDKGIGLSKEAKKHIFDKFYRVHTGNLHDVKGFGLGLSYVKAIMTAHKGQVDVRSELGKGSDFILFFPYQVEA